MRREEVIQVIKNNWPDARYTMLQQALTISMGTLKRIGKADELLEIQGQKGNYDQSEYMLGLFNGMELLMATIEDREPNFKEISEVVRKPTIEFDVLITNGYVEEESFVKEGFKFLSVIPAKMIHPHAMETDMAVLFTKYNKPVFDDHGDVNG